MHYLFMSYVMIQCIASFNSQGIRSKVQSYFEGESFESFQKYWQGHRKSFENAVLLALKDSYGQRDMNVYIRRSADSSKLADGLYFSDNIVDVLLYNLQLVKMPQLTSPEVTFALASNILRIESSLSKIIVESQYSLFRNGSTIATDNIQDPYKSSPFTFQQVKDCGLLTIVAEGCSLVGYTIVSLSGLSVNLGYDTFRVTDCEFHVEISAYQSKTPPVIVPYFDTKQRDILEKSITKTLRQEIVPILQASMFSYVNTSVIFGSNLQKYLKLQKKVFDDTSKYMNHIVRGANKETISRNETTIELHPIVISWNYTSLPSSVWNFVKISNTTVYGIDSLYSAHNGGPYKLQSIKIAETLRFNTLMVRGSFYYENNTAKGDHDFVVEIKDVQVNFEQDVDTKRSLTFEVTGWRTYETSIIELEKHISERKEATSLISGYLINIIPEVLQKHLSKVFAQNDLDKNTNDSQIAKSESEDDNVQDGGNVTDDTSVEEEQKNNDQKKPNTGKHSAKNLKKAALLLALAGAVAQKKNKLEENDNSQVSDEENKSETQEESDEVQDNRSPSANEDNNEKLMEESSNEENESEMIEENVNAQEYRAEVNNDNSNANSQHTSYESDNKNSLSETSKEDSRRKVQDLKASYKTNVDNNTINEIRK